MEAAIFVQNNLVERLTAPVAIWARNNKIPLIDVSSTEELVVNDLANWSGYCPVLVYGSVQFLRKCKASVLKPYIFHDAVAFANATWAAKLAGRALNSSGEQMPAEEVCHHLMRHGTHHVRPERVDKAFPGGVFDTQSWAVVLETKNLPKSLGCWVSPVQSILSEWRCWVIGGKVVEVSQYRANGTMCVQRETQTDIYDAAQHLANIHLPTSCVVLDMAFTPSGFKVVEFNPIHSSGWYAANVDHVLTEWSLWAKAYFV